MNSLQFDFVVIGSGLAGSCAALLLSQCGDVALLSKEDPEKSNSYAAQGGIAASVDPLDSAQFHLKDTLYAGDGLCDPEVVQELVSHAAEYMEWLRNLGVDFDRSSNNKLSLGLEGAHSHPRILHAGGDATGANVLRVLKERIRSNSRIWTCYQAHVKSLAKANGTVHGAWIKTNRKQLILGRKATILATGGLGQLFGATTNPLGATGEGIALGYQAGTALRNLEFIQFHPTALRMESNPKFLISEAVRGAGAILVDKSGRHIMKDHPLKDLAPRDQVARQIYEAQENNLEVFLDATGIHEFDMKFPTIYRYCRSVGLDPKSQWIPVTPAAHFGMGGIKADLNGKTSVPGLYAIGEVACTGVHGANRLASNSLLECIGMAHKLTELLSEVQPLINGDLNLQEESEFTEEQPGVLRAVQHIMWKAAGIVRNQQTLLWGLKQLQALEEDNRNSALVLTAKLIVESALNRKESRGAHYRSDYPEHHSAFMQDTFVTKSSIERVFVQ